MSKTKTVLLIKPNVSKCRVHVISTLRGKNIIFSSLVVMFEYASLEIKEHGKKKFLFIVILVQLT